MPTPARLKVAFDYACFYHLTFSCIDGLYLFRTDQHRRIFLQRCRSFLDASFVFLAYSLLSNEAHLIVKAREKEQVLKEISFLPFQNRTRAMAAFLRNPTTDAYNDMLLRQMNRFLVSYVNTFNYLEERSGALFRKPFRRVRLTTKLEVEESILFVHTCAQRQKIHADFRSHLYHSWHEIMHPSSSWVDANAAIHFFESADQFRESHQHYANQMPRE
jgi:hypothetical protein